MNFQPSENILSDFFNEPAARSSAEFKEASGLSDGFIPWVDDWLLGLHRFEALPCRGISLWFTRFADPEKLHPLFQERLLRYGYYSRTADYLVAMLDEFRGAGLSMPIYSDSDDGILSTIRYLQKDLHTLLIRPAPDSIYESPDSLPENIFLSAATPRLNHKKFYDIKIESALIQIACQCGIEDMPLDKKYFELVFDDLFVRVQAHSSLPCLLFDFFLKDASPIYGTMRQSLFGAMLQLNQNSFTMGSLALSLDNRDFIVGSGLMSLPDAENNFHTMLERWVEISIGMRAFFKALILEDVDVDFIAEPLLTGEFE